MEKRVKINCTYGGKLLLKGDTVYISEPFNFGKRKLFDKDRNLIAFDSDIDDGYFENPPSQPSEHNPPVDPLSVRADAVYNKRRTEDERNFERVKELLSEPLNVKGATVEKNTILRKHLGDERIDKQSIRYAVYNAMQEYAQSETLKARNEAINECLEKVNEKVESVGRAKERELEGTIPYWAGQLLHDEILQLAKELEKLKLKIS